jgi:cytochrome c1
MSFVCQTFYNVGLSAEGLGKGGDDGVSGWKHVDIGQAADGFVYEYKKSYWSACLACKHVFAQRSILDLPAAAASSSRR